MLSSGDKLLIEAAIQRFCDARVPEHIRDKVRIIYRWERNIITLFETRPYYLDHNRWTECPFARLRYTATTKKWTLYCIGRSERWRLYDGLKPATNIHALLDEVNHDPTHIFWG